MGIPQEEEREKRTEEIFKTIITKKLPKFISNTIPQIQKNLRIWLKKC